MSDPIPPRPSEKVDVTVNDETNTQPYENKTTIHDIKITWAKANSVMPGNVYCFLGDILLGETQTLEQLTKSGTIALTIITNDPNASREVSVNAPDGKSLPTQTITSSSKITIQEIKTELASQEVAASSIHIFLAGQEKELENTDQIWNLLTPSNKINLFVIKSPPAKSDKELLLRLAARGGPWKRAGLGWKRNLTPNQWKKAGVIFDRAGNVTSLDISNKNLRVLPPELGVLKNLQVLDLNNTELKGTIPPELGGLKNLQVLDLNNNELKGTIPPELEGLSNLQTLHLANNQLEGPIPPEFGNMNKLTHFNLSKNQLSGPIPEKLGTLVKLKTLYLQNNQLKGPIPPELKQLSELEYLYLNNNQLEGLMPLELYLLTVKQLNTKLDPQNKLF